MIAASAVVVSNASRNSQGGDLVLAVTLIAIGLMLAVICTVELYFKWKDKKRQNK